MSHPVAVGLDRGAGIRRVAPTVAIAALALLAGLLASWPPYLFALLGVCMILALGFLGEAALFTFVIVSSGVSLAFLSGGERGLFASAGGASIDSFRLLLALGAFIVLVLRRPSILSPAKTLLPYLTYLAFAALTLLWSPNNLGGIRLWCKLGFPVLAFTLAVATVQEWGTKIIEKLVVIAVLIVSALNLAVSISGASQFAESFENRFHGASHPNSIGLFSAFAGLTVYFFWLKERRRWYLPLILLLGAQLIATGSRTAFLTAGVGFLLFEWLNRRRLRSVTVVLAFALVWLLVPTFGERTSQAGIDTGMAPTSIASNVNISGRFVLWADAWSALMGDNQVLGRGLGTTDFFFASRYSDIASIHNGYLLLLIDTGFVGLLLLLVALFRITSGPARSLRGAESRTGNIQVLALSLAAMYLVCSLTESTFSGFDFPTALLWAILGVAWWVRQGHQGLEPIPSASSPTWTSGA